MYKKIIGVSILFLTLAGCADPRTNNNAPPSINNFRDREEGHLVSSDKLELEMVKQRETIRESQNAIQQSVNGQIAVGVSKIGEEVNAVKAEFKTQVDSLFKMNNDLKLQVDSLFKMNNELNFKLAESIKINNELQFKIQNQMTANSEIKDALKDIDAKFDATAIGIAGIGNNVDKKIEDFRAGGDIINNPFTKELLEAQKSSNRTIFWTNALYTLLLLIIVITAAIVIVIIAFRNKERVITTLNDHKNNVTNKSDQLQHLLIQAMGKLDKQDAAEICRGLKLPADNST